MKPISLEEIRKVSLRTPTNELIHELNDKILVAANKFQRNVEIDLSYMVSFIIDNTTESSHNFEGKHAFDMLPQLYKDVLGLFMGIGYGMKFQYKDWYCNEAYSERWEKKYTLTISW